MTFDRTLPAPRGQMPWTDREAFFANPHQRQVTAEYETLLHELLPPSWEVKRWANWLGAGCGAEYPAQGFKIHVSATIHTAEALLRAVVPVCVRLWVQFKVAAGPQVLMELNSKTQDRGSGGKFMTIYPVDVAAFRQVLEELYTATQPLKLCGPYILSDQRFRDSGVLFYRYGGLRRTTSLEVDGTRTPTITDPHGITIRDVRLPYFELPDWVADPFGGPDAVEYFGASTLIGRFEIVSALRFSNCGGIYLARDLETAEQVIVKEARPFTYMGVVDTDGVEAAVMLENEWHVLEALRGLPCVPAAVAHFQEWEHSFLIEEYIPGESFWDFWARAENMFAPYVRWPGRVEAFLPKFTVLSRNVLDCVCQIHERGILIGDVSPRNVLLDPTSLGVRLVDFDAAIDTRSTRQRRVDPAFSARWVTAGFAHPERRARGCLAPEDDYFAVGSLLHTAAALTTSWIALNPGHRTRFLDAMVELGLPADVRNLIIALWSGTLRDAYSALDRLGKLAS